MNGSKSPLTSKGVIGGVVAILAGLLALAGYQVTEADQVELVNYISGAAAVIGGLVALYGRIAATKQVVMRKPAEESENAEDV